MKAPFTVVVSLGLVGCTPNFSQQVAPPTYFTQESICHKAGYSFTATEAERDAEFARVRAQDTVDAYRDFVYCHHANEKQYAEAFARLYELLHPGEQPLHEVTASPIQETTPAPVQKTRMVTAAEPQSRPAIEPTTQDAMERALKRLRMIAAALETGMNYQQYGTRLVDAKMEVEEAIGGGEFNIPRDFKAGIDGIFRIYQDAQLAWQ